MFILWKTINDGPELTRGPGRPRVKRRRDPDEPVAPKNKKKKCSRCGELGHNKAGCQGKSTKSGNKTQVVEGPSTMEGSNNPEIVTSMPVPRTRASGKKGKVKNVDTTANVSQGCTQ